MVSSSHYPIPTSHMTVFCYIWWFLYFFSSHLIVPSSYCAVLMLHVIVFCHIWWFLYFFFSHLIIPSSYCAVPTSHVTVLLSHLVVPLFFFLAFYDTSLTLRNINITCDCTFVTFGGFLIFSHIWWYHPHIAQYQHYMWLYFCHILWLSYFFLTFDGTIHMLRNTNTTRDCTFVTFDSSLIFFHILWYYPHIAQY